MSPADVPASAAPSRSGSAKMPRFMVDIDVVARSALDQLAVDYFTIRSGHPSVDFCRRALGIHDADVVVARRLGVAISTVRSWREIGRHASSRTECHAADR